MPREVALISFKASLNPQRDLEERRCLQRGLRAGVVFRMTLRSDVALTRCAEPQRYVWEATFETYKVFRMGLIKTLYDGFEKLIIFSNDLHF